MHSKQRDKLNILILSYSNPLETAGIGSLHLKNGLEKLGHKVQIIVGEYGDYQIQGISSYFDKPIINNKTRAKIKRKICKYFHVCLKKDKEYSVQTYKQTNNILKINKLKRLMNFKPDIVLLFFTTNLVNYVDMFNMYREFNAPVFMIMPDMADFTGLCHYAWDCNGYLNTCGKCPAIFSNKEIDQSRKNLLSKIFYAKNTHIIPLSWSDWLIERIKKSKLFKDKEVYKIPWLTEKSDFFPVSDSERMQLRKNYSIENDSFVISFSALNLSAKRKGIKDIIEALNKIPEEKLKEWKITIIYSGRGSLPTLLKYKNIVNFGVLGWKELIDFYRISDLYLSASIQDVGPATIVEALLCGNAVISYNTGFAEQYIENGINGYIVDQGSISGLSEKIIDIIFWNDERVNEKRIKNKELSDWFHNPENFKVLENLFYNHKLKISK